MKPALALALSLLAGPAFACEGFLSVVRVDASGMEIDRIEYERGDLAALERESITTAMPWIEGTSTFEGPTFASMIAPLAEGADRVTVTALDEYESEMPIEPLLANNVIVADQRDGAPMSMRERGPLWLVFPFSTTPEIDTPEYHSRTVWQVCGLELS